MSGSRSPGRDHESLVVCLVSLWYRSRSVLHERIHDAFLDRFLERMTTALFREQAAALLKGPLWILAANQRLSTHTPLRSVARPVVQRRPFIALAVDSGFERC